MFAQDKVSVRKRPLSFLQRLNFIFNIMRKNVHRHENKYLKILGIDDILNIACFQNNLDS